MGPGGWGGKVCVSADADTDGGKPPPAGAAGPPVLCVTVVCRLTRWVGRATTWLLRAISLGLPHTLDIDGRRNVAPSPTPGFPLSWMLFFNVSSVFSEG